MTKSAWFIVVVVMNDEVNFLFKQETIIEVIQPQQQNV